MGRFGGDREDIGIKSVVFSEAFLEVFELGQDEEIVGSPMQQECLHLFISLRRSAAIRKGSARRLRTPYHMSTGRYTFQGKEVEEHTTHILKSLSKRVEMLHMITNTTDIVSCGRGASPGGARAILRRGGRA